MQLTTQPNSPRISWALVRSSLFALAICVPLVGTAVSTSSNPEDGTPRQPGLAAIFGPGAPPRKELRDWFAQHFAFRDVLMHWHSKLKVQAFGTSSSSRVVLGKDRWLYLANEGCVEDYRGTRPFTNAELEHWRKMLEERHDWLAARGCRYVFFVAPNKHHIYPEYMPDALRPASTVSRQDQLLAYMKAHSHVPMLDVRPALLAAKSTGRLYHQTDSHWNDLGAAVAEGVIAGKLAEWFPGVRPNPRDRYQVAHEDQPGGDLARFLVLQDEYREDALTLNASPPSQVRIVSETPRAKGPGVEIAFNTRAATVRPAGAIPRAVVFCDSFSGALAPFLGEHFGRAVFEWSHHLNKELIETEKPQVVIEECVEHRLMAPLDMIH
ncbi:MAG: hypothetical protein K0Q72_865 [Armatimonadetes bacterium]|nr:hypothetical protein [Armatimonadota bacterium]